VKHGALEKRPPHPLFDAEYYMKRYADARMASCDLFSHYIMVGSHKRLDTTENISVDEMSAIVPRHKWTSHDPISAFLSFGQSPLSQPLADYAELASIASSEWPPLPALDYWLPQRLRDHLLGQYGEGAVGLYLYLMSVIDRFAPMPDEFNDSPQFDVLTERLLRLSNREPAANANIDASIIIPVHNNLVYTLACIISILETPTSFSYEIIIGGGCSTDRTAELVRFSAGPLRLIRHNRKLGFLGNCNASAELAPGRYLVFLNNETLTFPGWLDALLSSLVAADDIGLAGSKLLNPDGTLQEAGGILWRDGSAWNFGRNKDPAT
jgi:hypothetical protein